MHVERDLVEAIARFGRLGRHQLVHLVHDCAATPARTSTLETSPSASRTRSADAAITGSPLRSMEYTSWPPESCASVHRDLRVGRPHASTGNAVRKRQAARHAASTRR